jgi:hypothetical protein
MTLASIIREQDSRVTRLELIERKLTDALTELRSLKVELGNETRDKGVLGSRGLTEFVLGHLKRNIGLGFTVKELLKEATKAGYAVPTERAMSKRLVEYRIRTGKVSTRSDRWWWDEFI